MIPTWAIISLLSAIVFGIKDILAKKFMKSDVSPGQIIFEQNILAIIVLMIIFFPQIQTTFSSSLLFWYLVKAICVMTFSLLYFQLLEKYDISLVSPMLNLSPVFLVIISFFMLSETITLKQFSGILIIIASTYLLEITVRHHKKTKPHQFHFKKLLSFKSSFFIKILIMIIFVSFAAISDKNILSKVNSYTDIFFTSAIVFFMMLFYYIKKNNLKKRFYFLITQPETLVISAFAILSNFLVITAIAIPTAMVSLIIPIRRTSTLFSSIFGGIIFHEKHLLKKMIATAFMLIGVLLVAL